MTNDIQGIAALLVGAAAAILGVQAALAGQATGAGLLLIAAAISFKTHKK